MYRQNINQLITEVHNTSRQISPGEILRHHSVLQRNAHRFIFPLARFSPTWNVYKWDIGWDKSYFLFKNMNLSRPWVTFQHLHGISHGNHLSDLAMCSLGKCRICGCVGEPWTVVEHSEKVEQTHFFTFTIYLVHSLGKDIGLYSLYRK